MLHCRVFDRADSPQPGVALVFHSNALAPADRRVLDLKTDAEGTASAKDLPPGAYEISLTFPHGGWSRWLKVEAGRTTMATFWVWGKDSGVASGRVTRHGGAPALDAQVFASPEIQTSPGAHMSYSTKVDAEGRYILDGLPPGNVRISAFTGLDALKVERTVEVPKGGSVTSDFVLGVPLLTGMVRDDATGEPIEGVEATLNRENRDYFKARTDSEGRFAFLDVPAGTYSLFLSRDGYGGGMLAGVTVETPSKDLDVRLRPAAVLHLRVLTPEGAPFVGRIWVSPVAKDPQPPFRQLDGGPNLTTDAQGRAVCRRIAPGDYELRIYTRMDEASFSKEHEEGQKSVRLVPGDNEVEVQLVRK